MLTLGLILVVCLTAWAVFLTFRARAYRNYLLRRARPGHPSSWFITDEKFVLATRVPAVFGALVGIAIAIVIVRTLLRI